MGTLKDALLTFSKAQCSAWVATVVDFGVTLLLGKALGMWYAAATFIGALCGGLTNCIINYRWVFHAKGQKKKSIAWRYLLVWSISIAMNTLGTYLLTELTGIDFVLVKAAVAVLVAVVWNYQMQRCFVFHHKSSTL